jgi:hypothetical protein
VLVLGELGAGNQAVYTQVGAIGPADWTFEGTGDFLGDGKSDILLQSTSGSGALVVGELNAADQFVYTQIGGVGPEWTFKGTGDYLGEGHDQFLIQDPSTGVVVVGDVISGSAHYTQVGGLGAEWSFH